MNERTTSSSASKQTRSADYGMTEGGEPTPGTSESTVTHDAQQQMADVARQIQAKVSQVMEDAPYVVPLAAGGVGFVAGALFSSKLARLMVMVAGGYALNELVRSGGLGKIEKLVEKAVTR